jgi:putative copper export protein
MANRLLQVCLALAVFYFAATGYAGYLVGKGIEDAKRHSLWTSIGTTVIGRNATERIALRQANLPPFVTQSPTFWMMLRQTE